MGSLDERDILCEFWDGVATTHAPTENASTLEQAYEAAKRDGNWARRLYYALELSKRGGSVADFIRYGLECGRNAMPERAEEAFQKALGLDRSNAATINGLAMCAFERVELGKSEELFRRAARIVPTEYGDKMLAAIAALPRNKPLPKRAEARRKFWKHWADTELIKLTDDQRKKRMAGIVARRRCLPR